MKSIQALLLIAVTKDELGSDLLEQKHNDELEFLSRLGLVNLEINQFCFDVGIGSPVVGNPMISKASKTLMGRLLTLVLRGFLIAVPLVVFREFLA